MSSKEVENLEKLDDMDMDMDDIDLDSVDLTKFGEVNEEINEPHIKISTKSFISVLKALKQVCQTSGRDVVSKSFMIQADNGKVQIKATDFDTFYQTEVECLNTDNVCKDAIVIPLDIVIKLVNVLPQSTIIVKKENNYFIHLVGGDMILETFTVDTSKYDNTEAYEEIGSISAPALAGVLRDFGPLVTAAINPSDRRICFTSDSAVAAYTYSVVQHKGQFADFDLKIKDMHVLATAIAGSDEVIKVYQTVDSKARRVKIAGEKFSYSFLVSSIKANEKLVGICEEMYKNNGLFVDFVQVSRLVRVAFELPYTVGKVMMNYDDQDNLVLEIQTKKQASSIFKLAGSKTGDIKVLDKPLTIQAKLFYTLLNTFRNDSSVEIILTDKNLGVKTDSYTGALLVE